MPRSPSAWLKSLCPLFCRGKTSLAPSPSSRIHCRNVLVVHYTTLFAHPLYYFSNFPRFLYSLNIPHTISEVVLVTDGQNQPLSKEAQRACAADVMTIMGITPPKCIVATGKTPTHMRITPPICIVATAR